MRRPPVDPFTRRAITFYSSSSSLKLSAPLGFFSFFAFLPDPAAAEAAGASPPTATALRFVDLGPDAIPPGLESVLPAVDVDVDEEAASGVAFLWRGGRPLAVKARGVKCRQTFEDALLSVSPGHRRSKTTLRSLYLSIERERNK